MAPLTTVYLNLNSVSKLIRVGKIPSSTTNLSSNNSAIGHPVLQTPNGWYHLLSSLGRLIVVICFSIPTFSRFFARPRRAMIPYHHRDRFLKVLITNKPCYAFSCTNSWHPLVWILWQPNSWYPQWNKFQVCSFIS